MENGGRKERANEMSGLGSIGKEDSEVSDGGLRRIAVAKNNGMWSWIVVVVGC
jgi:hypothetical protein